MGRRAHVEVTIEIAASPEVVWDFTQDYRLRTSWDGAITEARVEIESPERVVWVRGPGVECRLRYKLSERPKRTSLAMFDVRSPLFSGGGGSWIYEANGRGTRWRQVNTMIFRNAWVARVLWLPVRFMLGRVTLRAMRTAKRLIEAQLEGQAVAPAPGS